MNHQQPDFKPVYILGAGASKAIGAPLIKNFLLRARELIYSPDFDKTLEQDFMRAKLSAQFDHVFRYQSDLYKTRRFLGIDLDNLETLFSILDMNWQAAKSNIPIRPDFPLLSDPKLLDTIREGFFSLIIATLKASINRQRFPYDALIHAFAASEHSVFITFNYDTSIEEALELSSDKRGADRFFVDYGYSKDELLNVQPGTRRVLKLHGSANWTYCPDCDKLTALKKYITPLELESNRALLHLPNCPTVTALNVIIPPTWYKHNYLDAITRIWSRAIQEISFATHLFIIGYSFPRTDVFFEQLLTLGFTSNKNLKKIVVVDPDAEIKNAITSIFDTHFLSRSVEFYQLRFEDLPGIAIGPISGEKEMEAFLEAIRILEKEPSKKEMTLGEIMQRRITETRR
jgi:NAD-dependent SIR2 family protein deacetylase